MGGTKSCEVQIFEIVMNTLNIKNATFIISSWRIFARRLVLAGYTDLAS